MKAIKIVRIVRMPCSLGRLASLVFLASMVSTAHATAAQAASVTVTYQLNGGAFGGLIAGGPVTGGTASVLFPSATNSGGSGTASLTALTLTGPSGYFRLHNPATIPGGGAFSGAPSGSRNLTAQGSFLPVYPIHNVKTDTVPPTAPSGAGVYNLDPLNLFFWSANAAGGSLTGRVQFQLTAFPLIPFTHTFSGQEIHVPEPQSFGLLTLGLIALALSVPLCRRMH